MRRHFSLIILLLIFSFAFGVEEPTTLAAHFGSTPSASLAVEGPRLRLSWDGSGDLWVNTPSYSWNITGGVGISSRSEEPASYWIETAGSDHMVLVEEFFLSRAENAAVSARIVFETPQEAMVYLEKASPGLIEGLALTFRSWDGVITLSHHWQGSKAPDLPLPEAVLAGLPSGNSERGSGAIQENIAGLDPHPMLYSFTYDHDLDRGYALLQPLHERQVAISTNPDCYLSSGSIFSHELEQECKRRGSQPAGLALGRRYLLLYNGAGNNPFAPIDLLSNRLQLALPDLNVASISRTPRYDYDQPKNNPYPGDLLIFSARVANRGGTATGRFSYVWSINGVPAASGAYSNLDPGQIVEISLEWSFQKGPHVVALSVDGDDQILEVSEGNNRLEVRSDALTLGLWVEQSMYDWFNKSQVQLGLGGASWDDWAQRQVLVWNQIFAQSIHPLTPQGVVDRVRLEKVVVVPDGSLPGNFPSNYPDPDDKSVDIMWGFVCEGVGECSLRPNYSPYYVESPEALNVDYALLHELSHARYLDDLYGINLVADVAYLTSLLSQEDSQIHVDRVVQGMDSFSLPAYLALGGELVICRAARENVFMDCLRGAEDTAPRSHPAGSNLNRAAVRLQDGQGSLVMGSPALPLLGWKDHLYYNRYPEDIMSGGLVYGQHSAYALNRIAGERPVCGNYNRPCNLGEYQNDIPRQNVLSLLVDGQPASGAVVEVYRAKEYAATWYGKEFHGPPDGVYTASERGEVEIGSFPFANGEPLINEYNRLLLLKIIHGGSVSYLFFDVTQANEAYWSGQRDRAEYPIVLPTTPGSDAWLKAPLILTGTPGGRVELEVDYGNYGLSRADHLLLTLIFDPNLELDGFSIYPDHQSSGHAAWTLGSLQPMQSGLLTAAFRLPVGEYGERFGASLELTIDNHDQLPGNNIIEIEIILSDEPALPLVNRDKLP
jgi:hypothetical protein